MTEQLDDFCVWARPCNGTYLNPSAFNALEVWKAAQAAMPAGPAWISVTDRLPADDERVLVWPEDCEFNQVALWRAASEKWLFGPEELDRADPRWPEEAVTHWMPLPAGPGDAL